LPTPASPRSTSARLSPTRIASTKRSNASHSVRLPSSTLCSYRCAPMLTPDAYARAPPMMRSAARSAMARTVALGLRREARASLTRRRSSASRRHGCGVAGRRRRGRWCRSRQRALLRDGTPEESRKLRKLQDPPPRPAGRKGPYLPARDHSSGAGVGAVEVVGGEPLVEGALERGHLGHERAGASLPFLGCRCVSRRPRDARWGRFARARAARPAGCCDRCRKEACRTAPRMLMPLVRSARGPGDGGDARFHVPARSPCGVVAGSPA
jgi:hypothetical protein